MCPISDLLLGHTKWFFRKKCFSSYYLRHVWHMTQLKHGNFIIKPFPINYYCCMG